MADRLAPICRSPMIAPKPKSLAPIYWGMIVSSILAATIALATFWLGGRAQNQDRWVRHTLAVRSELQMIHTLLLRAESSQRGYLLTGRADYLSLYEPAATALQDAVNRAADLVGDNAEQVRSIGALRRLIADKLVEMQSTIDQRRAGHVDAALAIVNTDAGRRTMSAIREQMNSMVETEDRLLAQREAAGASIVLLLQLGSVAAFLLICGVGVLVAYFANRSISAIQNANAQLSVANRNLRQQIGQREEAESQLRQAQKMEAIGQLTGGIAHDFNNMLAVVTGKLDLMRRRHEDRRMRHRPLHATRRSTATDRGAALTQRLLAFARRQPLSSATDRREPLVADMSELLRRTLGEHIRIETCWPPGCGRPMSMPSQLESAHRSTSPSTRATPCRRRQADHRDRQRRSRRGLCRAQCGGGARAST